MIRIVGREHEIEMLQKYLETDKSEFIAVYGRRRVGKTFLIREFFQNKFTLYFSGVANLDKKSQLVNFQSAINRYSDYKYPAVNSWFEVFEQIINLLDNTKEGGKKIIFIDEIRGSTPNVPISPRHWIFLEHIRVGSERCDFNRLCIGNIMDYQQYHKEQRRPTQPCYRQIQLNPFTLRERRLFSRR
jgi:DNA polymerase III delta prime subunit